MQEKTIRLLYPQWQGGDIAHWFADMPKDVISQGYFWGAKLLYTLLPSEIQNIFEVPICLDYKRELKDGILGKEMILKQSLDALKILQEQKPSKILTLGGDCSVSVMPFSYLSNLYGDDVALIWLDAHPDIGLPSDEYNGYHAMALAHLLGFGDTDICSMLPAKISAQKTLIAGLHSNEAKALKKRQKAFGLQSLKPKSLKKPNKVLKWLKNTKASKVMIHFDLDVLHYKELPIAVGNTGKLKLAHAQHLIESICKEYELVGFSIAEYMPKEALKLKQMLHKAITLIEKS